MTKSLPNKKELIQRILAFRKTEGKWPKSKGEWAEISLALRNGEIKGLRKYETLRDLVLDLHEQGKWRVVYLKNVYNDVLRKLERELGDGKKKFKFTDEDKFGGVSVKRINKAIRKGTAVSEDLLPDKNSTAFYPFKDFSGFLVYSKLVRENSKGHLIIRERQVCLQQENEQDDAEPVRYLSLADRMERDGAFSGIAAQEAQKPIKTKDNKPVILPFNSANCDGNGQPVSSEKKPERIDIIVSHPASGQSDLSVPAGEDPETYLKKNFPGMVFVGFKDTRQVLPSPDIA